MSVEHQLNIYREQFLIRRFEEVALELATAGEINGSTHLYFGQEATSVGAVRGLEDQDLLTATYRGHGWAISKGVKPVEILAEMLQRSGGTNGGRVGSPMLSDPSVGFYGENSIVGAGYPIANGNALAAKHKGEDVVILTAVGDGAMNQGNVHEALVFAAANDLPVIFMCENNLWAEMTPFEETNRLDSLGPRAEALGIHSLQVDGNDSDAVEAAVREARAKCASGEGPVFIEARTHRLRGHYNRDIEHYREESDKAQAADVDPIPRQKARLIEKFNVSASDIVALEAEVESELESILSEALASPLPELETARDHLYAPTPAGTTVPTDLHTNGKEMTYNKAVNLALTHELEQRPEVIMFGEDIGVAGGTFGATRGLQKKFGAERIFDTPISETAILGAGIGASMSGMRPVVEIMWADFLFVGIDQLVNQASNVRYVNRSELHAPLTVRIQQGVTPGSCAQHSQSIEAILAHIPGIKVGLAATAQDAYSMLRAAVADDDPTVVIESRVLYLDRDLVDVDAPKQLVGGARFHRKGNDAAIITWGHSLKKANEAAAELEAQGIKVTVLDLRWLQPLDTDAISEAVRLSGGRVVVLHEAVKTGGFGAEISSRITEEHFDLLQHPVIRVATDDTRIPSAPALQQEVTPQVADIVKAVRKVSGRE